ncbi:MAG: pyrimidine dimer DNA glycosylase/endonuclease V [Bdellovibrionia bacterium]
MRLWSLHPQYLDSKGLVALWREGLLAQKVLEGRTKGYKNHPQLQRFKNVTVPLKFIGSYLQIVVDESVRRGYRFDHSKILFPRSKKQPVLAVTRGQLKSETLHLLGKLKKRDPPRFQKLAGRNAFRPHPIFRVVAGPVAEWEKI